MDSLGIYSAVTTCVLLPLELQKGQHAQEHTNMKADEHADAQQE